MVSIYCQEPQINETSGKCGGCELPLRTEGDSPTTKHVRADVGRAPSLVFQQVIFTHEVLSKTEVCYGYSMSPGENQKTSVNMGCPA